MSSIRDIVWSMTLGDVLAIWYSDTEECDMVVTCEDQDLFYIKRNSELVLAPSLEKLVEMIGTPFRHEYFHEESV